MDNCSAILLSEKASLPFRQAQIYKGMRGVEKAKDLGIVYLITYSYIFAIQ